MEFPKKQPRKPVDEQTPAELFLTKLGLHAGVRIKLVKVSADQKSNVALNTSLEGVLDSDVTIGQSIFLDGRKSNTSQLVGVQELNNRILFKTATSVYELVPPEETFISKLKSSPELNEIEKNIDAALKDAQEIALSNEEMNGLFQRRLFLYNQKQTPEITQELLRLNAEIKKHQIFVETLTEYRILMNKLGKNYYRVNDVVNHENAHANKTDAVGGTHEGYSVTVSKSKTGEGFSYHPLAHIHIPKNWELKKQIEANIQVGSAPEEYGNHLSDKDEKQIEILRNQLKNL